MNDLDRVRAAYPSAPAGEPPASTRARLRAAYTVAARARRRPSRRVALLAVTGLIAGGTAVAATTGGWRPVLGSEDRGARPQASRSPLPADQLEALAVLRRPQTDADRVPLVREALRRLSRETTNGIRVHGIRVVWHTRSEIVVLLPIKRVGHPVVGLPRSRTVRHDELCLMSASFTPRRRTIKGWGMSCGDTAVLRSTGIVTGTAPARSGGIPVGRGRPSPFPLRQIVLVPDGVASVRVRLRGRRWVTARVRGNVYSYTTREPPAAMGTMWFDAAGARIDHRRRP